MNPKALKTYGRDLVKEAAKFDRVFGRDEEIKRVVTLLSPESSISPLLIGEPGVGKTAVVEGIAKKIASGSVPGYLADVRLIELNMTELSSGSKYRGVFEERMTSVLKEVVKASGKVILFIDDIHQVIGAGQTEGSADAATMLKPMLARGQVKCIGTTTHVDFKKYMEKDKVFVRRFQQISVAALSETDTISILRSLKEKYERTLGVKIRDRAIVAAVQLSVRYITGENLPDKAIKLLYESCLEVMTEFAFQPKDIDDLERERIKLEDELHTLDSEKDEKDEESEARVFEVQRELANLRDKLQPQKKRQGQEKERIDELGRLEQKRDALASSLREAERRSNIARVADLKNGAIPEVDAAIAKVKESGKGTVGPDDVAKVLSEGTGIPVTRLSEDDKERLIGLRDRLHQRVLGQDRAVTAVADAVLRSRVGFAQPGQPTGSFLFLGPTGVGMTELARALAEQLFGDDNSIVRIDMSEFMEKHSVARLIGAPPGYVGHEGGGALTEAVKRRPFSVVLFDQVEKAHHNVLDILLQVLDHGRLTDSQAVKVDFTNTIIILTSNLGAEHILRGQMGESTMEDVREMVMKEVKKNFRPGFLNRIDNIVVFDSLSYNELRIVCRLKLNDIASRFAKSGIRLTATEAALDVALAQSYDRVYGARPVVRWLEHEIVTKLSKKFVKRKIAEKSTVHIDASPEGNKFIYHIGRV